jgi:MscS family membrane protein
MLFLAVREGFAQGSKAAPAPAAPAKEEPSDPLGRDTPRGSVRGFLKTASSGDFDKAADYLDTRAAPSKAAELARQLSVVLDRGMSVNLDAVSQSPDGDLKDKLPDNRDRLGSAKTANGSVDIFLDRVTIRNQPPVWLFSSETLRGIPQAYDAVDETGLEKYIIPALRDIKIFSVPLWRVLGVILLVVLLYFAASLVARLSKPLLRVILKRITGEPDSRYVRALSRPINLLVFALASLYASRWSTSFLSRTFWASVSIMFGVACASWFLIVASDIAVELRSSKLLRRQATDQIAVLVLARRVFKLVIVFVAVVVLLRRSGVDVSTMIAGLGIGGIALALGAQKTLEDLLGGITVISRHVVRVGDFCQIAGATGTVEDIGLNSTRIRTLDRTVISVSNAKVSQMNLENFSLKDKFWFRHVFGLRYDTPPRTMRSILDQVSRALTDHPSVELETARVRLIEFGPSSLNMEVFAYIKAADAGIFLAIQEGLMLQIMEIVDANGTSLALRSSWAALEK